MNPGVDMLMKLGRLGARLGSEAERAEMRGMSGVLNVEFSGGDGSDGSGWHIRFADGRVQLAPGLVADARATVRLAPEVFLALAAGDLSLSVARMTGRVRVAGDGGFGIVFGGFVGSLQNAQKVAGLRGWMARTLVQRALRKGGYRRRAAGATP